jgi:endonuclease YncB( thermonuclease family)
MAYHSRRYTADDPLYADVLDSAEREAQAAGIGVWSDPTEKPWEYRRRKRRGS